MTNLYHILHKFPALEEEDMNPIQESLSRELVLRGKFRIDADDKINFAKLSLPYYSKHLTFTLRELTHLELLKATKKTLSDIFSKDTDSSKLDAKVKVTISAMIKQISKFQKVTDELEMRLARIVVQSAHPIVIKMLILEKVEIFVSYSHNIGDVLDVVSWQANGSNSGMQSTDGKNAAIFISCGGNPFGEHKEGMIYCDGYPAIARITVVGAQEIGHFSDIIRDQYGRHVSRHSAINGGTRARENVRIARLDDIKNLKLIIRDLEDLNIRTLAEYERHLKFYHKNKIKGLRVLKTKIIIYYLRYKLSKNLAKNYPEFIEDHAENFLASKLLSLFADMGFNLEPKADVYANENKEIEEAIACIEALARVPQQAQKWGHDICKRIMKDLYKIYYNQVIPANIETYHNLTGELYNGTLTYEKHLILRIKKLFKKKIHYEKIWELE
jgi:hypothetical protein